MPTHVVCDSGDILLIADDGFYPPPKIKVSSVLLSIDSKVFEALLSGGSSESQAIRDASGTSVKVRTSDAASDLLLLGQPLHFKSNLYSVNHQQPLPSLSSWPSMTASNSYDQKQNCHAPRSVASARLRVSITSLQLGSLTSRSFSKT